MIVGMDAELRRPRAIRAAGIPRLGETTGFQSRRLLRMRGTTRGQAGRHEHNLRSAIPARRTAASNRRSRQMHPRRNVPRWSAGHVTRSEAVDESVSTADRLVKAICEKSCIGGKSGRQPLSVAAAQVCAIDGWNDSPLS